MALPSQSERSNELGRTYGLKGRPIARGNRKFVAGLVVAIAALGFAIGWLVIRPGSKDSPEKSAPRTVADTGRAESAPPTRNPVPPVRETSSETPGTLSRALDESRPGKPTPVDLSPSPAPPAPVESQPRRIAGSDGAETPAARNEPPPSTALPPSASTGDVRSLIEAGSSEFARGNLVQARVLLSRALRHPHAARADQESLRARLTAINDELLFSPRITAGDPLVESYTVKAGDGLERIVRGRDLPIDWRLVQRVNGIRNPGAIQVGQKLKLPRGPFHAVVTKRDYRCDIYAGAPDDPDSWLFIRSFRVGLGEANGTPLGTFVVKPRSKLINPHWTNPRTGEHFHKDDPKNPIGEHWIGIEGVGESITHVGYGLHGTIEPDSIGKDRSMGCVRMLAEDIALVYELLVERVSVVKIEP